MGPSLRLTAMMVVMAFFGLATGGVPAATARTLGPGDPPPQCAPGVVPGAGLLGAGGCLIQSGEVGFSISPHLLHVGEVVTATVTPNPADEHPAPQWSWGDLESVLQKGRTLDRRSHCNDDMATCTMVVGPGAVSTGWEVYSMGVEVPVVGGVLAGAVSSDYYIVDDMLHRLSGTVTHAPGDPVSGATVEADGEGGSETTTTAQNGAYTLPLYTGTYKVFLPGQDLAKPPSYEVALSSDKAGVDFTVPVLGITSAEPVCHVSAIDAHRPELSARRVAALSPELCSDPYGARVNVPVIVDGFGFRPGITFEFGNDQADATPESSDIAEDGKWAQVTLPRLATTGTLTASLNGATAALRKTFEVDSFRNTVGFSFNNPGGTFSLEDVEHVFGIQNTSDKLKVPCGLDCGEAFYVPNQATLNFFTGVVEPGDGKGECFGWDLSGQRLSTWGDLPLSDFSDDGAQAPWDLFPDLPLQNLLTDDQLVDYSDQVHELKRSNATLSVATLLSEIQSNLNLAANGVIVTIRGWTGSAWAGHALLAYDVEPQDDGGFVIDVADPNIPFSANENHSGLFHSLQVHLSQIHIEPDGSWSYAPLGWSGYLSAIGLVPYADLMTAIDHGLTFADPGPGNENVQIPSGTTLTSLTDPTGATVDIADPSAFSGVQFVPSDTAGGAPNDSFIAPSGRYVQTLTGSHPQELVIDGTTEATLAASAGTDEATFDPASSSLTLAPAASANPSAAAIRARGTAIAHAQDATAPSSIAAIGLLNTTGGVERSATISGPAAQGVRLAFQGSSVQLSAAAGDYSLTLSEQGNNAAPQLSTVSVRLTGATQATVTPNWQDLGATTVGAALTPAQGPTLTRQLRNIAKAPSANIRSVSRRGRAVSVALTLPAVANGSVEIIASVAAHKRALQTTRTIVLSPHAARVTERLELPKLPTAASTLTVTVVTQADTDVPTFAAATRTVKVG